MEEKVKKILVEVLGVSEDQIVPDATIENDLGADSIDVMEVALAIEEELDIKISNEDIKNIKTVDDLIKNLKKG